MCGFAGILNNSFIVDRRQVGDIAGKVSFRGPDSCGIRIYDKELKAAEQGNSAMFFNRLAILDLDARSDQPFEDERYSLLFNGEIYNYQELKGELQKKGYVFHTTSDTEVVFYAIKEWGIEGIKKFNGMFALCRIDRERKTFLLARDRMGIKPLYYCRQGKSFLFGSELDSVLRLSAQRPGIQTKAIHQFLWSQYIPTPYTIVQNVFKLPPGHFIEGSWNKLEDNILFAPTAYWDAYVQAAGHTDPVVPSDLEQILVDSLSRQMIADVPLGMFLSSGVDSSLLAALVNKHFTGKHDFNLFTVAFKEATASDESNDALQFISGFNNSRLKSHTLEIDASLIGERLDGLYDRFDEPFGDPASLLNWVIAEKAREFVTVALSGDGADELFWGYKRYDQWKNPALNLFDRFLIPQNLAKWAKPFLPGKYWREKANLELEKDPLYRHFTLFLPPVLDHLQQQPPWKEDIWAMDKVELVGNREDLTAIMDIKTYLADAMLHKVDRASMAASLEVRVPYLDNKVVDYALALPFSNKSNIIFRHKAVLKQLLQQLAPHYAIDRSKKGFNFPLDQWLRYEWKEKVLSLVNKDNLAALGLDEKIYLKMLDRYYSGEKRYCIAIWYLFNLVLWYQKFKNIRPLQRIL